MSIILHIFQSNILPLFILVAIGVILQKKYHFDVKIFAKLLFTVYIPAVVFIQLYRLDISYSILRDIFLFVFILYLVLTVIVLLYIKLAKVESKKIPTFFNSVLFYNSGNYGLPLILLVFPGNSLALSIQVIIVVFQTLIPYTVGMITINSGKKTKKELAVGLLKLPVLYAIFLGMVFHYLAIPLPQAVEIPLDYIANGFIALALLTLGLQLGNISWKLTSPQLIPINIIRLVLSPGIALLIVYAMDLSGVIAQVLIISSAVPTAVNVVLLDIEYDNHPEFSSQIVLSSTIFSAFTITAIIYFVQVVF
ncbi:AEC family transporter [Bacillus alkalicellulosilyticus]|uniref:AEC family transporter n=1 Tax=Alkalihalobacterium alkalicellulosilyticum TaxID=1912214 RepID=UPI0009984129|nr:AEC family transporter [Bacillus alkalicellulosilyticus]